MFHCHEMTCWIHKRNDVKTSYDVCIVYHIPKQPHTNLPKKCSMI